MADIRINPDQVEGIGGQFGSKRGELEALVGQANSLMSSLQGAWTGTRATKTFNEWETLKPSLTNAVQTLQQASNMLKAAATAFRGVDSGG